MSTQKIICGDNIAELKKLPDNYADSIVTDAPYGLGKEPDAALVLKDWVEKGYHEIKTKGGFMGKSWDSFVPQPLFWKEVFRVLKPGGHVLCFFGTRTYDWGVMAIRLAGFEIRDCIQWIYGSGFPKSMDVSKAADKAAGVERDVIGQNLDIVNKQAADLRRGSRKIVDSLNAGAPERNNGFKTVTANITAPTSDLAKQWDGWGTALKPANEPIVLARKPLIGTVVENILEHGVGGINIDGCRIAIDPVADKSQLRTMNRNKKEGEDGWGMNNNASDTPTVVSFKGRFPANVILDEEAGRVLDEQTGVLSSGKMKQHISGGDFNVYGKQYPREVETIGDAGGASRFFYCAKTSQAERNKGLDGFEEKENSHSTYGIHTDEGLIHNGRNPENRTRAQKNNHPTVKPVSLMRYLVRLITPAKGLCIDPFNGSGTTGIACKLENVNYIGIDMDEDYCKISEARIVAWEKEKEDIQIKLDL